ncbi:hypothetical protein M9978_03360 [Sphingomonas sp. MG17]|uniref:Uncharacterized protein n=1 Tax=Sphingomonas tagetis TaxID=2949092 RepID=A0A9X2HIC3_9SPHN|nr:hypothetical protein [Sphingomonas tagetis]MCP3729456.1 hypothetical protein [Sphingomonas tagetis]
MLKHRDRRATTPGAKFRPPLRGCPWKAAELRRLLARSFSYAAAPPSLSAAFHGQSILVPIEFGP